jgi:hypothetical protein
MSIFSLVHDQLCLMLLIHINLIILTLMLLLYKNPIKLHCKYIVVINLLIPMFIKMITLQCIHKYSKMINTRKHNKRANWGYVDVKRHKIILIHILPLKIYIKLLKFTKNKFFKYS